MFDTRLYSHVINCQILKRDLIHWTRVCYPKFKRRVMNDTINHYQNVLLIYGNTFIGFTLNKRVFHLVTCTDLY